MIPSQPVASLPLSPAVRQRLGEAGFHTLRDLIGWDPLTLARDAGISHEDALLTLKVTRPLPRRMDARLLAAWPGGSSVLLRRSRD